MQRNPQTVDSPIGKTELDHQGSAIGAVRMDPGKSYADVPGLLKKVIDEADEAAWAAIKTKIDYTHTCLSHAMDALDAETGFAPEVKKRVESGQKILFKPNLVGPVNIDRNTHGAGNGSAICTNWCFLAALMRWFHDRLHISYHGMSVGEAGSAVSATAAAYTRALRGKGVVTTEGLMEGKVGDFYGGWGFYFARKYLAETHPADHGDDPMNGYEESVSGTFVPPGKAGDKLMVYDLNKVFDDGSNGREVPVPGGVNFETVTVHKAVVGGDPRDPADRKDYPGAVLINAPKLKVHDTALLTNAVKNLGIGLYPMEVNVGGKGGGLRWKYSFPHRPFPGIKNAIPHSVWVASVDEDTLLPRRADDGSYLVRKTGGMSATMADIIAAVQGQDIFMLHVTDAIGVTNGSNGIVRCKEVPEGYVFAGADPVALDLFCARYMFTTVPWAEAGEREEGKTLQTTFFQRVTLPQVVGNHIVGAEGVDAPVTRDRAMTYCRERGLGRLQYYVVGKDKRQGGELSSAQGHLGRVEDGVFHELLTTETYFSFAKPLWDLQAMTLAYLDANDRLNGSSYRQELFDAFDENGDGIIDYDETGRKGYDDFGLHALGCVTHLPSAEMGRDKFLQGTFLIGATRLRCSDRSWNGGGHDFIRDHSVNGAVIRAMEMSRSPVESPDPFFASMTWGKGKWPSLRFVRHMEVCAVIYGPRFPDAFDTGSLYGLAFRHADAGWGQGAYSGSQARSAGPDMIGRYHGALANGAAPLPFVFYVPAGYGKVNGKPVANVVETDDPAKIFTAQFDGGTQSWRELSLASLF